MIETHRPGHMRNQYHMLQIVSHSEALQRLSQVFFTLWPLLVTSAGHKQECTLALQNIIFLDPGQRRHNVTCSIRHTEVKHLVKLQDRIAQYGNP